MTESVSNEEKAGLPLPPPVQFILAIPPDTIHPCLLAAPFDRNASLAQLQEGFASLTDDELKVARLWLRGATVRQAREELRMRAKVIRVLWASMRLKLKGALRPNG